jgi:hypothetical protein
MRSRRSFWFSIALVLLAIALAAPALAADSKLVLNDNDFKALNGPEVDMDPEVRKNGGFTREYFASLKTTSVLRQQICDSRGLFRRIAAGICRKDDLQKNFRRWLPQFFNENEQDILINCQINIATE